MAWNEPLPKIPAGIFLFHSRSIDQCSGEKSVDDLKRCEGDPL
jgi:hypothetical protein